MWFPIASLCLLACLIAATRREGRRGPLVLALSAWAVALVLGSPAIFSFDVSYSLTADAFIGACLSSLTIVYLLCRAAPRPAPRSYDRRSEVRIATKLGCVGALGCALLLLDATVNAGLQFNVGYLLDNLSAIRTDNADALATASNRGGLLVFFGTYLAPCAVLSVVATAHYGRDAGTGFFLLGAMNFVLIALVSLAVYAGRATVVNVVLLVLISLFVSGRRLSPFRPRTLIVGALLLGTIWYLSTDWLGAREQNADSLAVLDRTQRAEPRPWLARAVGQDGAAGLAIISVGYFASPIPTLAFYMQQPGLPGPFYGSYSYPLPARIVQTVTGTWRRDGWLETRREIYTPIEARGYFGNVWATWLRDLLVDFGYLGAIAFCGLFGGFMAWASNRYELTGALHYQLLAVIACFTLGFGAFTSFLWLAFLAYPFFLAIAMMLIIRLRASNAASPTVTA